MVLLFMITWKEQVAQQGPGSLVKGRITDSLSGTPLGYASIQAFSLPGDQLLREAISEDNGAFSLELPYGRYYVEVTFMGYASRRSAPFTLSAEKPTTELGNLSLAPAAGQLEEVIVQGQKSTMQLTLDKRIFNVGQDISNVGGSALDILSNIPSLSVDPEGNVRLRGSDNVRILIDGKPSGLVSFKGGSGLQQLQASMIERVEIITNPSARYEAEGMAGILNIILKKDKKQGFNGSLELISGDPANFGGAANLNYRHNKINFFINYGITYRKNPGRSNLYQEVYTPDTLSILKQQNNVVVQGLVNNIRGGIDYFFSENSVLTGYYLFRRSDANRIMNIRYEDFLFNTSGTPSVSTRKQDENEDEPNSEYSLAYKRSFAENHELTAEVKFLDNWESSNQMFYQHYFASGGAVLPVTSVTQRSLNDEWEKHLLAQLDYSKPLWKDGKMEAGFRTSFRDMTNDYVVSELDEAGNFIPFPEYDNVFFYDENIHAAYGILSNKTKKFSYQAGLRAEWTDVQTTLEKTNEVNPRNYMNLFPSAHFSYEMKKQNSLQLSYSRRVRRPFYNDLSPFFTFSDSRNYFSGNPDLDPEFSNVFEIGHLKTFDNGSFLSSLYYRDTHGKIHSIRRVGNNGYSTTRPENLLSEQSFGVEFISSYSPFNWWKTDLNLNFFHADIDGSNILKGYTASTNSLTAQHTSRFSFPRRQLDLQFRVNYEAARKTVQGEQRSICYADFSASKDLFKGNGTVSLSVIDLFNTRISRYISTGPNFYTRGENQYRRRQVNLTLAYRIRQAKQAKQDNGE